MITKYNLEITEKKHPILVEEESYDYDGTTMTSPQKIVDMVNKLFHLKYQAEEHLYMCSFDIKMNILGVFEVSHGGINTAPASPREILIRALLSGASGVIILHNHPSLENIPSNTDKNIFKQLLTAFSICGLELQDFIIVGSDYFSFKDNNYFK